MNNIYEELLEALKIEDRAGILTTLSADGTIKKELITQTMFSGNIPELMRESLESGLPRLAEDNGNYLFAEPFCKEERMIICGGGHVSYALGRIAAITGFSVIIIDDREEFANKERFPFADEVICDTYENAIPKLGVNGKDYLAIITRGHADDADCLRLFSKEKTARYTGMIGSRKRVAAQKELLAEEGISRDWLARVHNPIGLAIGAVTPEEIAISIMAEVIQVKRLGDSLAAGAPTVLKTSEVQFDVIEKLAFPHDKYKTMKHAIVTITETRGSSPRKAGAKMVVYENGDIVGTVGGGLIEGRMIDRALELMKTGGYSFEYENLNNDVAANNGMVCGGDMKLLIEC